MAIWLKQSTSVDLPIGPFVDATDGVTAETGLTLTQPDIRLKKNAGNWAQKNAAQTLSHEENGWYEVTLDATDTDTLGQLKLAVNESGALPVWADFTVVPANVWDSLFGSDKLQVDVAEWLGTAAATPTVAGVPEVDVTHWKGSVAPDNTGDAFARLGAPAGASIAADLVTIDNFVDDLESRLTAGRAANLDNLDAAISSRSTVTTAQVNTEVVDVIRVDTISELAQAAPAASPTVATALMLLYMALRNEFTQTATLATISNDAGTVICKSTTSDDATTFTRGEWVAGP
jgi:hypothetical protein